MRSDYVNEDCGDGRLEGYDWLVFCAGNDLGNYPGDGSVTQADYFEKANIEALPRFFEAAKRAGIARAAQVIDSGATRQTLDRLVRASRPAGSAA